ncbi:glycosyltransferase family 39 protein [Hyphomicrobium sp. LHD-15]|uniref:ArnT family glycosyltransferase n=1 Tax=Hyphomicrobium sp. LHD-15 TaxID=3072142 RepID=UPI00280F8484|nr:glycosyltransferase family 39 protein [Hyphomicrobium sp. LHD-15]MDQ8699003.1 glycosyltransferase family 39 protein [Hyphomicrobium sp. LHD-15]
MSRPLLARDPAVLARATCAAVVILFAALCVAVALLPAVPIDETRYLTVAWEMRATGNWSLPTLNFEPYSHKPPLLFWLINTSWSIFGLAVWPARLIGALSMAAVLVLTHMLEKRLLPRSAAGPAASALMLLALPLFVALGFSIMFDMLLTATVTGAMLALWIAGRTGSRRAFVGYAICVGLGLLAKGPVALLFTLPAALLGPVWIDATQKRGWTWRIALSVSFGVAIALAWALRAAYLGGPEFAEMLFWKQSAGRITSSFAHARPIWFYLPIILMLLTPILLWRPALSSLRNVLGEASPARNFLLAWAAPAFIGLSLVSGKQLHYLIPLLPAVALLAALGLERIELRKSDRIAPLAFAGFILIALSILSVTGLRGISDDTMVTAISLSLSFPPLLLAGALALAAIAIVGPSLRRSLIGLVLANLVVLTSLATQSRAPLTQLFDLAPVADIIAQSRDRPIAMTQESRGEFGFLARLTRPPEYVPPPQLACWILAHPDGLAIVRERDNAQPRSDLWPDVANVLLVKKYRTDGLITVVEARRPLPDIPAIAQSCATRRTR